MNEKQNAGNADAQAIGAYERTFGKENYHRMRDLLATRVNKRRFKHSKGVAKTAKHLAKVYGYDPKIARMAGILHDWDKGLSADQERARVEELGISVNREVFDHMPWLLHGPTAAAALKLEYPELGDEVFQSIARHTSGAAHMEPLDCIIYVADIIEPSRTFGDMDGIQKLRSEVGNVELGQLYFDAFKYTLQFLVENDRQLAPSTIDIWNALMQDYGFVRKFR